jgi:EmrB/QacA subfamily drug resistance transporter
MSHKRTTVVIIGIMLSLFMSAIEATVVATAMPTIVSQLGGLAAYSWVFSAYMLTSTTTVPLYGKLSDLYGRRPLFFIAMVLFLLGSILCGLSQTMGQLIAFRALQGLGAGGLIPLAFIIIGDILPFEQRARTQGLFSGVWGVASVAGPLLGGILVDQFSWRWVFYVNIIPGFLAILLVGIALRESGRAPGAAKPSVDFSGAFLLTAGVVILLLGLFELGTPTGWTLLAAALILFAVLFWVERRAVDPMLPLPLFRERLFSVAIAQGVLSGWAMFGSTNFVPLFGQGVLGLSATAAGTALTPMMLSWTAASVVGGRLLLRYGYRSLALVGTAGLAVGAYLMTRLTTSSSLAYMMLSLGVMGAGMGLAVPAFLIAVQSSVQRSKLGTATATLQFSRSIGGTLGVSVMGVILTAQLAANLAAAGISAATVSLGELIDPSKQGAAATALDETVRGALAGAIDSVFVASFIAAGLALAVTFLTPRGRIAEQSDAIATSQPEATPKSSPT